MSSVLLAVEEGLFSRNGLATVGWRWLHIVFGITWIGLLYYFNFVQVPSFAAFGDEARARNIAIDKLARRALWWFRWAAVATAITGLLIAFSTEGYFSDEVNGVPIGSFGKRPNGVAISVGMLLGIIMLLNVWGVIWRNQKVVLANAANVVAGGEADPNAAAAGRKAFMASRMNTIFSVSMVYFMVTAGHPIFSGLLGGGKVGGFWIISLVIIVVLELNALGMMPWKTTPNKGLNVMFDGPGVRNPLIAAFGLWVVFVILTEVFFRS